MNKVEYTREDGNKLFMFTEEQANRLRKVLDETGFLSNRKVLDETGFLSNKNKIIS